MRIAKIMRNSFVSSLKGIKKRHIASLYRSLGTPFGRQRPALHRELVHALKRLFYREFRA